MPAAQIILLALFPAYACAFSLLGYYTSDGDSYDMLVASKVDSVAFDAYDINAKGHISGNDYPLGFAYAKQNNLTTWVTVSNYQGNGFNKAAAHSFLNKPKPKAEALANLVKLAVTHGYDGVNCDFENVAARDRQAYTAFVQALAGLLHAQGLKLMLSVPAKTQDDPTNSWDGAYDFAAIGLYADLLQVMTYDENGPWGPPGPVAGLNWVTQCIDFAISQVPKSKISQGINGYGYTWPASASSGGISYKDFPALIAKVRAAVEFDPVSSSVHFNYMSGGVLHTVWFDNNVTIALKAKEAKSSGVHGLSLWSLGQEDMTFWNAVRSA